MKRTLLTAPAAARICECDLKTIHNWANTGKLDAFRTPGKHLRIKKQNLISFLEKHGYDVPEELYND